MTIKKFDYSQRNEDVFYKEIYPAYAKEFLFGSDYENFAFLLSSNFIFNADQWAMILEHWELKESLLSVENK
jgi:hypothetical protein